jgi:hypothetical protein
MGQRSDALFDLLHRGDVIHGTYEQRDLGYAVAHGCVRLSVKNAATLLVNQKKMANTTVVLSGAIPDTGSTARARPKPLNTDNPGYPRSCTSDARRCR